MTLAAKDLILIPATISMTVEDYTLQVTRKCQVTGKIHTFDIAKDDYDSWVDGKLVQKAFPHLTIEEREIIITGWTQAEWDILFKDIEED